VSIEAKDVAVGTDSDFRLTPGSFTKLENLIFNQDTTSTVFAGSLPIMDCAEGVGAAKGCFLRLCNTNSTPAIGARAIGFSTKSNVEACNWFPLVGSVWPHHAAPPTP